MNAKLLTIIACSLPMAAMPAMHAATPTPTPTTSSPSHAALLDEVVDVEGTITSVDQERKSFAIEHDGEHVPLKVDESTSFTLDGDSSTFENAVQTGLHARVTHQDGTAVSVDVQTER